MKIFRYFTIWRPNIKYFTQTYYIVFLDFTKHSSRQYYLIILISHFVLGDVGIQITPKYKLFS